jgi:hypothetical protein
MKCEDFQDRITDYLDGTLPPGEASAFGAHRLGCSECRELVDAIGLTLEAVQQLPEVEPPLQIMSRALVIPALNPPLDCERVESLVTEFLDGYLEPGVYHALEDHFGLCEPCSDTLAGVVLAVSACHSVHFSETVEVPDAVVHRILAETSGTGLLVEASGRRGLWAWFQKAFGLGMRPVAAQRFATAALIVVSTYGVLGANGGSLNPLAIYEDAARLSTRIYSRSTEIASKTGEVLAEMDRLRSDVDQLFGRDPEGGQDEPAAGPRREQSSVDAARGRAVG